MIAFCKSSSLLSGTDGKSIAERLKTTRELHALRAGFTLDDIFNFTKIDRWFLTQIKELVDFEEELAGAKN
jgi:hypothetical protein